MAEEYEDGDADGYGPADEDRLTWLEAVEEEEAAAR